MEYLKKLLICALISSAATADAAYIIHSVKGSVTVTSAGKRKAAAKGLRVSPSDKVSIPEGGRLEVINDVNNTIYTSTSTGEMSLTRLMLDSKAKAADNSGNINSRLNFSGRSGSDKSSRVYVERGMVKRSLADFDPEASNLTVQPAALAARIAALLRDNKADCDTTLLFSTSTGNTRNVGFTLTNTLGSPVYFNVIRLSGKEGLKADISPLGQPSGSYVILPGQMLARGQETAFPDSDTHILIATHYAYDIDEFLDELTRMLNTPQPDDQPELALPVFIRKL